MVESILLDLQVVASQNPNSSEDVSALCLCLIAIQVDKYLFRHHLCVVVPAASRLFLSGLPHLNCDSSEEGVSTSPLRTGKDTYVLFFMYAKRFVP